MKHDAPIAPAIVEQASEWLMLHWGGELHGEQRHAFAQWQAADAEHRRAWQRLQHLQHTLGGVPADSARAVLRDTPDTQRRAALKLLGALLMVGGSGYLVRRSEPWQAAFAEHRTATGEIRYVTLSDGTRLDLNSDSAVDVRFSATERRIRLIRGEILLTSGHDALRPLIVETAAGDVQALGTRFGVRELDAGSRVDLYEGRVRVTPVHGAAVQMNAGDSLWFDQRQTLALPAVGANGSSWTEHRLIAERQPLGEFVTQLSRYRPGLLRCDPAVSGLLLTGVFPLNDTDAILAALERSLPVHVQAVTRYWVTIKARV
ncbi:FecR domain-containing protein [Pseudomonas rhodesiae]|jgi:transmembrane sensor|uniref:FecR domain-containing protein n=1 Tax=Pseudomonas rhodesiae TaxID=76760 RepID=UPI00054BE985|nr:FecR domain-containing protein [Pseudomonas rhodesiae]UVL09249.1 FecR domain-containing protein [Pseudomonas rhodesiae]